MLIFRTVVFKRQPFRGFLSSLYTPPGTHPYPPAAFRRALSESSNGNRGGSESPRFKHRVSLLWWGTVTEGHARKAGSQTLGDCGSWGIQNDHWRVLDLKTGCHCPSTGKPVLSQKGLQSLLYWEALACRRWGGTAPDRPDAVSYPEKMLRGLILDSQLCRETGSGSDHSTDIAILAQNIFCLKIKWLANVSQYDAITKKNSHSAPTINLFTGKIGCKTCQQLYRNLNV